ncbi:MAG: AMP-binding protein, partial [Gammaproteobacteria bacterium]|nr:AMP-binding protein [Gammaproteobacteria bacterium]
VAHLEDDMIDDDSNAELDRRLKSGRPLPMVDLRIVDEQMNDVPRDGKSTGEVVVRAPWVTQGYFKNPEASEALWRGGYLHTGDIGHIDDEGYLKVTDRVKDVIKSGGEWISSILLEDIVSQFPGVAEAAAIGVPDERWGERPVVLVVPSEEARGSLDCDAIREHVRTFAERGEISRWAVPERIELVDSIDKTSVGKIDKKRLRQRYG